VVTGETGAGATTLVVVVVRGAVVVVVDAVDEEVVDDETLVEVVVGDLVVVVEGLGATVVVVLVDPVAPAAPRVGRVTLQTVIAAAIPAPRRTSRDPRPEQVAPGPGCVPNPAPLDRLNLIDTAPLSHGDRSSPSRITVTSSTGQPRVAATQATSEVRTRTMRASRPGGDTEYARSPSHRKRSGIVGSPAKSGLLRACA
jgi:hypothetical protein